MGICGHSWCWRSVLDAPFAAGVAEAHSSVLTHSLGLCGAVVDVVAAPLSSDTAEIEPSMGICGHSWCRASREFRVDAVLDEELALIIASWLTAAETTWLRAAARSWKAL